MSAGHGNPLIERVDALLRRHRAEGEHAAPPVASSADAPAVAEGHAVGEPALREEVASPELASAAEASTRAEASGAAPGQPAGQEDDYPLLTEVAAEGLSPIAEAQLAELAREIEQALLGRLAAQLEQSVRQAVREAVGRLAAGALPKERP